MERREWRGIGVAAVIVLAMGWQGWVLAGVVEPKGFGSADVAAAIQQAERGDTVQLSAGVYELSEALRPKSGVKIVGAGAEKTRVVYRGTKPGVMVSIVGCEDVELAQFTLDGEDNQLIQQGIAAGDSRRLRIHHVTIRNLAKNGGWGPHAILFSGENPTMEHGVTDSTISDCRIEKIGLGAEYGGGIRMAWGSMRNVVERNVIDGTGRGGIFGDHSAELIIRNNRVSGSGGEGLGIEIWGGCPRSLIEDNVVDHWISVDQGNQSAVRRNTVGLDDGTLKGYGIEIIARDMVVTDNVVKKGAMIGLSVSNVPVKNNVYWGYNRINDCIQWAAQLQGDSGGIARQYFYRCTFEKTVRGDERAIYKDSGHGFRTNGGCRSLVLEECTIGDNGGIGVQLGGKDVDGIRLLRCRISGNGGAAVSPPGAYTALDLADCAVEGNGSNVVPEKRGFAGRAPTAEFRMPEEIYAGEAVMFQCASTAEGRIEERLWDLGEGIPQMSAEVKHTYERPGKYRVTLVVWDSSGQGGRVEKWVEVRPRR